MSDSDLEAQEVMESPRPDPLDQQNNAATNIQNITSASTSAARGHHESQAHPQARTTWHAQSFNRQHARTSGLRLQGEGRQASEELDLHPNCVLWCCISSPVSMACLCSTWYIRQSRPANEISAEVGLMEKYMEKYLDFHDNVRQHLFSEETLLRTTEPAIEELPSDKKYPTSCAQILSAIESAPSGYYVLQTGNGSAVRVYCDMTRSCGGVTGGWTRVAGFNFRDENTPCLNGFKRRNDSRNSLTCGIGSSSGSCSSMNFDTYSIPYTQVCGMVLAYQHGTPEAFNHNESIDSNYVDGVSLTYGSHPRKHIWSFASGSDAHPHSNCQCSNHSNADIPPAPSFVGSHYFCEVKDSSSSLFVGDDPLWDGQGCQLSSVCCSFNNPPWFYRQLSGPVTADIEMRVCADQSRQDEDIALAMVEIFVQ